MQTYNFSVVLLVKTGTLKDDKYNRLLLPFTLNTDPELRDTLEDPMHYLTLTNIVLNPSLMAGGTPWQKRREILDVLYQVIIEMCSKPKQLIGDLSASTSASYRPSKASGRHFFGLGADMRIYNVLLKPLSSRVEDSPLIVNHRKVQPWHANRTSK